MLPDRLVDDIEDRASRSVLKGSPNGGRHICDVDKRDEICTVTGKGFPACAQVFNRHVLRGAAADERAAPQDTPMQIVRRDVSDQFFHGDHWAAEPCPFRRPVERRLLGDPTFTAIWISHRDALLDVSFNPDFHGGFEYHPYHIGP